MKNLLIVLGKVDALITAILKWLTIVLFLAITLIVTVNILLRIFPITSFHWSDEITEMCFAGLVFYGAAGVWMVKGHFSVGDWIGRIVKGDRAKSAIRLVLEVITLLFAAVLFKYSLSLSIRTGEATSVFQIPKKIIYSCMPISSLIMVAYSLVYVARCAIGIADPKTLKALDAPEPPEPKE
jgi:TRAP-type C4-dicarboxylate transport system permease small subunit